MIVIKRDATDKMEITKEMIGRLIEQFLQRKAGPLGINDSLLLQTVEYQSFKWWCLRRR